MVSWRELVREETAVLSRSGDGTFELGELYGRALRRASEEFPDNDHPKAKIRQTLQKLRDDGEISFLGDGVYRCQGPDPEGVRSEDGDEGILSEMESELDDLESRSGL